LRLKKYLINLDMNPIMKIIGIVCSPREGGNTEILVRHALESARETGAAETELIHLGNKHINPCKGCDACERTGKCCQKDDMQDIYGKLISAHGIIIGTPVYFWGVTAQAKTLMDRTYCLVAHHRAMVRGSGPSHPLPQEDLRGKVGGIITVTRRAGATPAVSQVSDFFRIHRIVEAGAGIAYAGEKGDVRMDEQGMRESQLVGRSVVRMIHKLEQRR